MNQGRQPPLIVWWMIWASLLTGLFFFYHFLGGSDATPPESSGKSSAWLVAFAPVALSSIMRWFVLPRITSAWIAFRLFVAGMAMAEAACFLGLFIFPQHKQELFILSGLGIFQFIPFFARRYFIDDTEDGQAAPEH
jgi:hypothetical protein